MHFSFTLWTNFTDILCMLVLTAYIKKRIKKKTLKLVSGAPQVLENLFILILNDVHTLLSCMHKINKLRPVLAGTV